MTLPGAAPRFFITCLTADPMPRLPLVILIVALVTASGLTLSEGRKSLRPLSKNLSSFRGASSSSSASFEASKDHLINSRSGLAHFQAAESTLNAVITDANNERDLYVFHRNPPVSYAILPLIQVR